MPERDGDPIFQSAVSGNHQFCITVACSNSASDHTARGRRPDTGSPGGISGSAAGTGAAAICAPYRGGRSPAAGSAQQSGSCDADYYRNSDGNCVRRPEQAAAAPAGATARCSDGKYSFSQHRQGTCSGHGGVAQWL